MVRGSALRVTALDSCGGFETTILAATSKSVVKVAITEITDGTSEEMFRDDVDQPRLRFSAKQETIGYQVEVDFLRVDPGLISLITGAPLVLNAVGDIVGFDADTSLPVTAFALEVWSKLSGVACADGQMYGYTLFPFLKGGYLSGFKFGDGLVSFNLRKAVSQRGSKWGLGPYIIEGDGSPLATPVSGNTSWRTITTPLTPPDQQDGVFEVNPIIEPGIDGGSASSTTSDILDGEFVITSSDVVDGGGA